MKKPPVIKFEDEIYYSVDTINKIIKNLSKDITKSFKTSCEIDINNKLQEGIPLDIRECRRQDKMQLNNIKKVINHINGFFEFNKNKLLSDGDDKWTETTITIGNQTASE